MAAMEWRVLRVGRNLGVDGGIPAAFFRKPGKELMGLQWGGVGE